MRMTLFASFGATAILLTACEAPHGPSVPWPGPTDGVWQSYVPNGAVGFGKWSPVSTGAMDEYVFAIIAAPTLTSYDSGKSITMTSTMQVRRVKDKGFNEGVGDQFISFQPGVAAPENSMNEDYGEDTDVICQNDRPRVGEETTCTISFTAPAGEIANSHWTVNSFEMGTWPSQTANS